MNDKQLRLSQAKSKEVQLDFFGCLKLVIMITGMLTGMLVSAQSVVDQYGRLQVYNAKVCAEDGEQISLGGMSFFWSNWDPGYYTASTVDYLANEFEVSIVRAAAGVAYTPAENGHNSVAVPGGMLDNYAGTKQQVKNVVDAAIANGIYVIIDWHLEGKADKESWWVDEAKKFFREMAQEYGNYPNVIYEVYNEPAHDGNNTGAIQWFCQQMVNEIRQYDPDNLIICGSAFWSQQPNSYSINDNNIAYTFHAYPDAEYGGSHMDAFYANVPAAMNAGNAVFVTEFGAQGADHDRTDELINACQDMKISMCAWSVNNKPEPWSIFSGSGTSNLTPIGTYYRDRFRSWPYKGGTNPPVCTTYNLPGRLEAEAYCTQSGTQTEATSDPNGGDLNVGYIDAGDWMEYSVSVANSGSFIGNFRVAAEGTATKSFDVLVDGSTAASVSFSATGGWQSWTSVPVSVSLTEGTHTIRLLATSDGFNINYMDFTSACESTELAAIDVSPDNATIAPGESLQLTATGKNSCGDDMSVNASWSANAPNGLFSASEAGSYQVTASAGGYSDQVTITVTSCTGTTIPGTIQAENYSDMSGVQVEGNHVGYLDAGDWMDYAVDVSQTGTYKIALQVASNMSPEGQLQFALDGATTGGVAYVPNTGGWQNWTEVVLTGVNLSAGCHTLRINVLQGPANIDYMTISEDVPASFSLVIEAENYNFQNGTQTEACSEGGLNVGYLDAGDWLAYHDIDIPQTGSYTISYRVASASGGGQFNFEGNGGAVNYGTMNVAATGGWQSWTTISHTVSLTAGVQNFGIGVVAGGFNINWIKIESSNGNSRLSSESTTSLVVIKAYPNPATSFLTIDGLRKSHSSLRIMNLDGRVVEDISLNDKNRLKVNVEPLKSGTYIMQLYEEGKVSYFRFVKQ